MKTIEAHEIRALRQKLEVATEEWEREPIRAKLDNIADNRTYGELRIVGEDGVDTDEALGILFCHGTWTVDGLFAASHALPKVTEPPKYVQGMAMLGLSAKDRDRLAASFARGKFPTNVIDAVVSQQEQIQGLHPDKYPFPDTAYDVLSSGLSRAGFDTRRIWRRVEKTLVKRGRGDLALIYGYDNNPTNSLTGFLEHYALTRHDIGELSRTRRNPFSTS